MADSVPKQSDTWQSELTFSDRYSRVMSIASAVQRATPGCSSAQLTAKLAEKKAYDDAASIAQYEKLCQEVVEGLSHPIENSPCDPDTVVPCEGKRPRTGSQLGNYSNASHYRDGLFSTVYKAFGSNGSVAALKLTTPSAMAVPHNSKREAQILREAASPHVISLLETFQLPGGRFVLVFPFMPYDLEQLFHLDTVPLAYMKSHLQDLFAALSHIHECGIIHRDIKPSNILLASPSGPAFLCDFGIAWSPSEGATESSDCKITDVGTTSYRPPELLFGHSSYSCALDLWAAGCVVAEAVEPSHNPLFNSGELGSELALIRSIFISLGTPTLNTWPEASTYPDWGKMEFIVFPQKSWSELLPNTPSSARDLVSKLVRYESGERLTAAKAMRHPFFRT